MISEIISEAEIEAAERALHSTTPNGNTGLLTRHGVRMALLAARRVSSAPSFADGIEAAAKVAIELGTAPLEGANIRIGIGNAIAAAIRALAHNPQASSGGDTRQQDIRDALGAMIDWVGAALNCADWHWDGDQRAAAQYEMEKAKSALARANSEATSSGRMKEPCGECHLQPGEACDICGAVSSEPSRFSHSDPPRSGAAEGNEAEAPAPKPDQAIAELVEGLRELLDLNYLPDEPCRVGAKTVEKAISALTASNDRVAELERERDEANRDRVTWAYNAGHSADELLRTQRALKAAERERDAAFKLAHEWAAKAGGADVRAEAAEAEVSRLKADIGRKEAALLAFASEENWRQGGAFDPNSPSFCGIGIASAALSNQAGASK